MSGRISSVLWVDMGYPDINKVRPVYPNGLPRNIVPLRPSSEILTVPQVNVKHCWSNSGVGGSPNIAYRARHDRKCAMALSMFIAGSVDSLATNQQAQPAYTHKTCNLP
eukprot:1788015-Pleurochrysis_carterae.AAC.1